MIKKLLFVLAFALLPLGSWAQSLLPPCPSSQRPLTWHNCIGNYSNIQGGSYSGAFKNGNWNGEGIWRRKDGSAYVGNFSNGFPNGAGIEYFEDGRVNRSGMWEEGNLAIAFTIDTNRYSFKGVVTAETSSVANASRSQLPSCNQTGAKNQCFGTVSFGNGVFYIGELHDDKFNGRGTFTFADGSKHVGEWKDGRLQGEAIAYLPDGSVSRSGRWSSDRLVSSYPIDKQRFPFNALPNESLPSIVDPLKAERDRLSAEVEAERKKRQELETQLAEAREREKQVAEAKERERQQAQAPQPQRPQVALRNERRLALVIGNSSYKVSPLDNPANDANDVSESLKKFGFQTTLVRNATLGQMREATRKFADQLPSADVALIYFAGHGIESNRKNYMIPVNADLKFEYELADQGYDAGIWLEMLESIKSNNADRVNIVILDACRNNSLIGSRNLGRGLGKMDAPSGTFLAYSTAPGKVAADGGRGERNSPFTKHLIRAMQQPNQPIEEVFKEVRRNVGKETNGAQVPWESTSLTGFFTFRQGR
jgi:hypothetical protein